LSDVGEDLELEKKHHRKQMQSIDKDEAEIE
jgi:hypothetical protein